MTCEGLREQLSAFLDGELDVHTRREVESHLQGCAECRQAARGLTAVIDAVHAPPPIPDDVLTTAAVLARLAGARRETVRIVDRLVVREMLIGAIGLGISLWAGLALRPVTVALRVLAVLCRPVIRGLLAEASIRALAPLFSGALVGISLLAILSSLWVLRTRRL